MDHHSTPSTSLFTLCTRLRGLACSLALLVLTLAPACGDDENTSSDASSTGGTSGTSGTGSATSTTAGGTGSATSTTAGATTSDAGSSSTASATSTTSTTSTTGTASTGATTGAPECADVIGSMDCAALVEVSGELTLERCELCQGIACGVEPDTCDVEFPCVDGVIVLQGCCADADCEGLAPYCGMFTATNNVCVLDDDL